uniref:DUF2655 domain-containing protein n=1 Tax=Steinernema glaseri TaxID=37863 RepID=A0A1I7YIE4_9BILA
MAKLELELIDTCQKKAVVAISRTKKDPLEKIVTRAITKCFKRKSHMRRFAKSMCCPLTRYCDENCTIRAAERMLTDFTNNIIY